MNTSWIKVAELLPPPPKSTDLLMYIDDAGVQEYIVGHIEEDENEGDIIVSRAEDSQGHPNRMPDCLDVHPRGSRGGRVMEEFKDGDKVAWQGANMTVYGKVKKIGDDLIVVTDDCRGFFLEDVVGSKSFRKL